jgi:cytosine/creatinine deaminase
MHSTTDPSTTASVLHASTYWLTNAHVPIALLQEPEPEILAQQTQEGLSLVDIQVSDGKIAAITPAARGNRNDLPALDLRGGQVWCCFVDLHTHLDKGHIWGRASNPDGRFETAIATVQADREKNWDAEDVYRRMEFGLKCSYGHGTKAIRTHIDAWGKQAQISLDVFNTLKKQWADRLMLQVATIVGIEAFESSQGEKLADHVAEVGGLLGGFPQMNPDLDAQLDRVFSLAKDRNLNLDFHTDENDSPDSITLRHVAQATIRHQYEGRVVCGHCCSLAVQSPEVANQTMNLVKQAGIGIVSLPMCNLYLQDRSPGRTPHWRGITLLHELKQQGIPVAIGSDNCRDPFHGFGDHDALEVFSLSAKIAHLDAPYGNWSQAITTTPADLMGLPQVGRLAVGLPADLILFKGRNFSELLSRSQHDRTVLRNGKPIDRTLPDYAELDDLQLKNGSHSAKPANS